jgi:RNA-binding protein NOB1
MASPTTKPIHTIVLDAGPIIKNEPPVSTLLAQSEALYTIPAVIQEIRDAATRTRVETTLAPFLTQRTPRPESMKVISDFARRTGDLEVLSRTDLQLMALSYELEVERNGGDWRLRAMPGQKRLNGAPPEKKVEGEAEVEAEGEGVEQSSKETAAEVEESEAPAPAAPTETRGAWGTTIPAAPVSAPVPVGDNVEPPTELLAATSISAPAEPVEPVPAPEAPTPVPAAPEEPLEEDDAASDDGGDWITPSNIKKHQEAEAVNGSTAPAPTTMQVATITSDFAMQNVMLRMNLNLLSPALSQIRTVKTWVLRCHACFLITKDMTRQFCSRCGKPTLMRTSVSTTSSGETKVHLKKNMQWNHRGDRFSIPKPVAGSTNGKRSEGGGKGGWGMNLVLAEDQKEYEREKAAGDRRRERDLMDEDYLPNILTGDRRGANGRIKVGAGRNVNSRKRR